MCDSSWRLRGILSVMAGLWFLLSCASPTGKTDAEAAHNVGRRSAASRMAGEQTAADSSIPVIAGFVCDADSDCFYVPRAVGEKVASDPRTKFPALLVLHCDGARAEDLDSFRLVGDSLGWIVASCHATRNHRDMMRNDADIVRTAGKLLHNFPVDPEWLFVCGYSGQGVQALAAMFLHPEMFRGVITTCAHAGALELAEKETLTKHFAYLITRVADWNRVDNETMARLLGEYGVVTKLVVTEGEHTNGPRTEVLEACRWLARQTRQSVRAGP